MIDLSEEPMEENIGICVDYLTRMTKMGAHLTRTSSCHHVPRGCHTRHSRLPPYKALLTRHYLQGMHAARDGAAYYLRTAYSLRTAYYLSTAYSLSTAYNLRTAYYLRTAYILRTAYNLRTAYYLSTAYSLRTAYQACCSRWS